MKQVLLNSLYQVNRASLRLLPVLPMRVNLHSILVVYHSALMGLEPSMLNLDEVIADRLRTFGRQGGPIHFNPVSERLGPNGIGTLWRLGAILAQ